MFKIQMVKITFKLNKSIKLVQKLLKGKILKIKEKMSEKETEVVKNYFSKKLKKIKDILSKYSRNL